MELTIYITNKNIRSYLQIIKASTYILLVKECTNRDAYMGIGQGTNTHERGTLCWKRAHNGEYKRNLIPFPSTSPHWMADLTWLAEVSPTLHALDPRDLFFKISIFWYLTLFWLLRLHQNFKQTLLDFMSILSNFHPYFVKKLPLFPSEIYIYIQHCKGELFPLCPDCPLVVEGSIQY